jgi:hypothetical protein
MAERWRDNGAARQELPIMWPRLSRWWPWHPAVCVGVAVAVVAVAFTWASR